MKIGYDNLLKEYPVSASSEAPGFEKENAYDGATGGYWKPDIVPASLSVNNDVPVGVWMGDTRPGILFPTNLVSSGKMESISPWSSVNSSSIILSNVLRSVNTSNGAAYVYQKTRAILGKQLRFEIDFVSSSVTGGIFISVGSSVNSDDYGGITVANPVNGWTYFVDFEPTSADIFITFGSSSSAIIGEYIEWDNAIINGITVNDLSNGGNDLTIYGQIGKTRTETDTVEYSDFSDQSYMVQKDSNFNAGYGDYHAIGWIKTKDKIATTKTIFERGNSLEVGHFGLYINPVGNLEFASNITTVTTSIIVNDGIRRLIAVLKRNSIVYLYVNGNIVSSFTDGSYQTNTTQNAEIWFGINRLKQEPFTGGYMALWSAGSYSLTSEKVKSIYEKEKFYFTKGGKLPETFASTRVKIVNYFAMFDHDFAMTGSSVVLQYSDDNITWANAFDPLFLSDKKPIFKVFSDLLHKYFRVYVNGSPQSIGACSFGHRLDFDNGMTFGFAPPSLAQHYMPRNNISNNGEFIGRSMVKKPLSGNFVFNSTFSPVWIRQFWPELMRHLERKPFFALPQDEHPGEALFCWVDAMPGPEYSSCYMSVQFPFKARVE